MFVFKFLEKKINWKTLHDWDCSGMALVTVLILVIILTLLAVALLGLQSNQVSLTAHDIRRTRARYAEEAAMVHQLERLQKQWGSETSHSVDGLDVNMSVVSNVGPGNTDELNFSRNYFVIF